MRIELSRVTSTARGTALSRAQSPEPRAQIQDTITLCIRHTEPTKTPKRARQAKHSLSLNKNTGRSLTALNHKRACKKNCRTQRTAINSCRRPYHYTTLVTASCVRTSDKQAKGETRQATQLSRERVNQQTKITGALLCIHTPREHFRKPPTNLRDGLDRALKPCSCSSHHHRKHRRQEGRSSGR